MGNAAADDLLSLDRDVSHGWEALTRWRVGLALDASAYATADPLQAVRHVAGKTTWNDLAERSPSAADVPLRDGLRRWVFALTLARIGRPDEVALARAASEISGRFDGDRPLPVGWRTAWRGVVAAKTPEETRLWIEAALPEAQAVAAAARTRAARRAEVARRFGVDSPWALLVPVEKAVLHGAAARFFDASEDLSRGVWKESLGDEAGMAPTLHAAMARDAGEGWPATLRVRWFDETFRDGLHGVPVGPIQLPPVLGAASFARALHAFGVAVRVSAAPPSMPFALAREPAFVGAHRLGFAFAALASDAGWQSRVLGIGRRAALLQARALARSALLDARIHVARLLLGDEMAFAPADRFEEIGARLFAGGLAPALRGAWPAAREDEAARFVALLEAPAFAESLRDRFDSDWYRNPRAWAHLRGLGSAPAYEPIDPEALGARADSLARAFERTLG